MKSVADSKIYIKTLFYNWFFGLHCFEIYDSLTDLFVHNIRKLTLYNERKDVCVDERGNYTPQ